MIPGLGHEPGGAPLDRCSPCIPGISEIQRYYRVRGYGLRNGPAVGWRVEVSDTRFGGGLSGYEGALMASGTLGGTFEEEQKLCPAYLPKPSGQAQGGQGHTPDMLLLTRNLLRLSPADIHTLTPAHQGPSASPDLSPHTSHPPPLQSPPRNTPGQAHTIPLAGNVFSFFPPLSEMLGT